MPSPAEEWKPIEEILEDDERPVWQRVVGLIVNHVMIVGRDVRITFRDVDLTFAISDGFPERSGRPPECRRYVTREGDAAAVVGGNLLAVETRIDGSVFVGSYGNELIAAANETQPIRVVTSCGSVVFTLHNDHIGGHEGFWLRARLIQPGDPASE